MYVSKLRISHPIADKVIGSLCLWMLWIILCNDSFWSKSEDGLCQLWILAAKCRGDGKVGRNSVVIVNDICWENSIIRAAQGSASTQTCSVRRVGVIVAIDEATRVLVRDYLGLLLAPIITYPSTADSGNRTVSSPKL